MLIICRFSLSACMSFHIVFSWETLPTLTRELIFTIIMCRLVSIQMKSSTKDFWANNTLKCLCMYFCMPFHSSVACKCLAALRATNFNSATFNMLVVLFIYFEHFSTFCTWWYLYSGCSFFIILLKEKHQILEIDSN